MKRDESYRHEDENISRRYHYSLSKNISWKRIERESYQNDGRNEGDDQPIDGSSTSGGRRLVIGIPCPLSYTKTKLFLNSQLGLSECESRLNQSFSSVT